MERTKTNHELFVDQRNVLLDGIDKAGTTVGHDVTLLIGALVLIADELHRANEDNRGMGVFRDCLLKSLAEIAKGVGRWMP